ncbi:hypothetical protein GCM10010124_10050 [Pilimelia terevasa]|uniref:Peptidase M10 metallopeptidase domain-containing protein n=1 Tax=Pilimelia terevasa TaxID=53372 RepID=A0A8J3BGB0_9ACTN|nr:hypothetical protein GCM10010124_10050 [Pilimelia terevasa]
MWAALAAAALLAGPLPATARTPPPVTAAGNATTEADASAVDAAAGAGASAVGAAAGAGAAGLGDREVWSARQVNDDVVEVGVYTPGDGVTPQELYRELDRQGVRGLRRPAAARAGQCRLGTAYALEDGRCPPIRWAWAGYPDPQVHFRDRTPRAWPVKEAVRAWNRAPGVDSHWTDRGCPRERRHCVEVRSGDFGSGWAGNTTYRMTMGRNFVDGSVLVRLNDRYATSTADRRSTACHELGHALGVGHNTSTASCMYPVDNALDRTQPHRGDVDLLRRVIYP